MASFYKTKEWIKLRNWAISKYGASCMKCGSTQEIECDHILPRSRFWWYRLKKWNVQVLCKEHNGKKGNSSRRDYRPIGWKLYYCFIRALPGTVIVTTITTYLWWLTNHPI